MSDMAPARCRAGRFVLDSSTPEQAARRPNPVTPSEIESLIREALDVSEIVVQSDDNVHFEAQIVSSAFEGKRAVARHQMVYAALGDRMRADIHALSIRALTPAELAAQG